MSGAVRDFYEVAKIPEPGDNVAIAIERMEPGTEIERDGARFTIAHTVLEGHRFAAEPIARGREAALVGPALRRGAQGHRPRRLRL